MLRLHITGPAVVRGSLVSVPKDWVDMPQLRHELQMSNGSFWGAQRRGVDTSGMDSTIQLYWETKDRVLVPRHYQPPFTREGMGRARLSTYTLTPGGRRAKGPPGRVSHSIVLRNKIQREASAALQRPGDKILALGCGTGKTVVSLHAAAEAWKFPVLIVVHTNELLEQWMARIEEFWGIPKKNVGIIRQKEFNWRGKSVCIAMLQTVCKKQTGWPPEFFDYFSLVIFDEVHRLGAEYFSQACALFSGERWGLSATLKRDDGMDKIIRLHCGSVCYENLDQPLKPQCYFIHTKVKVNEFKYRARSGMTNLSRLMTDLSENFERNTLILHWINKAVAKGRTILVLGERLAQLHWLLEHVESNSKALCVGSIKSDERKESLKKQVVLATQHLAKEGLDRPAFDTLFILFPFGGEGRLRQSIGRILRIKDGKKGPLVVIFQDDIGIMRSLCLKMRDHLHRLSFKHKSI